MACLPRGHRPLRRFERRLVVSTDVQACRITTMRALVTGCAGFIGSHLSEALLSEGHSVVGVDCFTEYYDRSIKERNLADSLENSRFTFEEADLAADPLDDLPLSEIDVIFHLAAQPGVRNSWGADFATYERRNILATQRLLEAVRDSAVEKFVFASSSSVYGDAESYPTNERVLPRPISPYGVTKLAGEHLCFAYARDLGVEVAALRFFTVYGPRQRPDMAFNRFIQRISQGEDIEVYGDGRQTRDFTFVSDVVSALVAAGSKPTGNRALNVGGGSRCELIEVLRLLGTIVGREPQLRFQERQRGDVRDTGADLTMAKQLLDYQPRVRLEEGLRRQVQYMLDG